MLSDPVSLVAEVHKGLRVSQKNNAEDINDNHLAKVYLSEFTAASPDCPIVFIKDDVSGQYTAALMWGVEHGQNLFVENNEWKGGYVPASVRCYPFTMTVNPEQPDSLLIGLFDKSAALNKEEGELIFNDDGTETQWMKKTAEFLVAVYQEEQFNRRVFKDLESMGLFVNQTLTYKLPEQEQPKIIEGFFVVDQQKLAELSDENFLKLRKLKVLEAIYAHIASLSKSEKLMKLSLSLK